MTTNKSANLPVSKKKSQLPFIPTIATLCIVFLGIIGYLMHVNANEKQAVQQKISELEEAHLLQTELELQVDNGIAALEAMRGENESMNYLIDEQEAQLEIQKGKIASLLKDSKKLKQARTEIKNLKTQIQEYLADVESLRNENEMLAEQNASLAEDRDILSRDLSFQIVQNVELNEAQAVLVSQRDDLNEKVKVASVVKVVDVDVTGVKTKPRGKSIIRKSAKSIDQLRVCFKTLTNEIISPGIEKFYVRIINPAGETMAIEDLGSGFIQDQKTGENVRFTQVAESEYTNDEQDVCFLWEPNMAFQSGNYEVEIYNKGYLAGTGNFVLK